MERERTELAGRCVANAADAHAIARQALPEPGVGVLHIDRGGRLLGISVETVADGVALPVQRALRDAVRWESSALLIAHRRPADDPEPSAEEVGATHALAKGARELGVRVLDRLDFTPMGFRSFRALGLL